MEQHSDPDRQKKDPLEADPPECSAPAPAVGGDSGYYYDDATGYEVYNPDADDDETDEADV
jgi:hypothetical protein